MKKKKEPIDARLLDEIALLEKKVHAAKALNADFDGSISQRIRLQEHASLIRKKIILHHKKEEIDSDTYKALLQKFISVRERINDATWWTSGQATPSLS